jgi:hypothetical protein
MPLKLTYFLFKFYLYLHNTYREQEYNLVNICYKIYLREII